MCREALEAGRAAGAHLEAQSGQKAALARLGHGAGETVVRGRARGRRRHGLLFGGEEEAR